MTTTVSPRAPYARRRRAPLRLVFYGFLAWLPTFAAASAVQTRRETDFPLVLAVLVVTMTASVALFCSAYLREAAPVTIRHGLAAGLTWMALHLLFALVVFVGGPLGMPAAHFRALAVTTLIIPIVAVALAVARTRERVPRG